MDVFEAVRTVLAVREYDSRPVPDDVVRTIVEAAHLTASSMNAQPWHFVVVRDPVTLQQLGAQARSGPYTAQASFAVAVCIEHESKFGVSDASRAAQSMMLVAWEHGVGSNWVGFGGLEAAGKLLDVPAGYDVLALLPFGYPKAARGRGKKQRKPLGEVASSERWGQPFA
jgi:nitroreductase